jgi:hypothetical protein
MTLNLTYISTYVVILLELFYVPNRYYTLSLYVPNRHDTQ